MSSKPKVEYSLNNLMQPNRLSAATCIQQYTEALRRQHLSSIDDAVPAILSCLWLQAWSAKKHTQHGAEADLYGKVPD